MSAWIRMIPDDEADADLTDALSGARTPHGTVDNVLQHRGTGQRLQHLGLC